MHYKKLEKLYFREMAKNAVLKEDIKRIKDGSLCEYHQKRSIELDKKCTSLSVDLTMTQIDLENALKRLETLSVYYFYDGSKPPYKVNINEFLDIDKENKDDNPFVKDHDQFKNSDDDLYNRNMSFSYYIFRNPTQKDFRTASIFFGLPIPSNINEFPEGD